jgi:hypothetical protein
VSVTLNIVHMSPYSRLWQDDTCAFFNTYRF